MDSSCLQLHQGSMGSESLDSMVICTKAENGQQIEKKARAADEQAQKCPRCDSSNTKFCYYNNYSLSQPRYFCKSCRRYWTKGGTLRNVPVGGGCRKNRRPSKRNTTPDHHLHLQVPGFISTPTSSSSFSPSSLINSYDHNGNISILGNHGNSHFGNPSANNNNNNNSFLEALRSGLIDDNNNNNNLLYYDDISMHQEIMSNASSGSSTPTIKQESGENRMLWGFPWQLNGNTENEMDSLRETWNNAFVASSWNTNLLYTPLM